MRKDIAISELIGALLIVAMIAGAVGIITVVLISQPHPVEKAAGDFQLKIDPPQNDRTLYITHIRGDNFRVFSESEIDPSTPAENSNFKILVDNIERSIYREEQSFGEPYFYLQKGVSNSDYVDYFTSGDTLVYKNFGEKEPDSVAFIDKKQDGSEYTLWVYGAQVAPGTDADFYAIPRNPCVGTLVHFYDASNNNPTSWEWDFGDGTKSTEKNPSHAYTSYNPVDRYTITLKTNNGVSTVTKTKNQYIQVKPLKASFVISPVKEGDIDLTLQFTDTSQCFDPAVTTCTPLTWNWEFSYVNDAGNKVIEGTSTDPNPQYTFQKVEDYTIRLTITDGCGNTDSTEQTIKTNCPICSANAAARPTEGYAELTVEFAGSATGGKNFGYSWIFGDGKDSIQQNPTNLYQNWGEYTAILTATNDCGNSGKADPITINVMCPPVEALFSTTFDPENGDAPLTVQFTDESHSDYSGAAHGSGLPITTWHWDFGDGEDSIQQNPSHVYQYREEPYTVTLTAGNECNSGTFSRDISVNCPAVIPSFTAEPMSGDAPLTVQFTDTSTPTEGMPVNQWSWDFDDGTRSGHQNPSHQFAYREAPYIVTLTAGNGCNSNSFSDEITVLCPAVDASFTFDPPTGQAPLTVQFTDKSTPTSGVPVYLWSWDFGDDTPSIEQNPSHEFAYRAEPYTVTLTVSNGCNSDTYSQSVTVTCPAVNPSFEMTLDPPDGRAPLSVTFTDTTDPMDLLNYWEWDFGDGSPHYINTNYSERNPPDPHMYVRSGTYPVTLTVRNSCGEQGRITHDVIVTCDEVVAKITAAPITGYAPLTVAFDDNSTGGNITDHLWDFGDPGSSNNSATEKTPIHTFSRVGTYTVNLIATNDCGNSDVDSATINVHCPPVIANYFANQTSGYAPLTVLFTNTSSGGNITSLLWDFEDPGSPDNSATINNPVHTFTTAGTYQVNLTVWNDCGNSDSYVSDVTAICEPMYADFSWDMPADTDPYKVQFHSPLQNCGNEDCEYDILDWEWNFEDGTANVSGTREPFHTFPDGYNPEGKFVTLTVKNHVDPVCNNEASIRKQITFNCPPLYASFTTNKSSGPPGSVIAFTDTSTPQADIMRWRWIFGDTSPPWESTDPLNHNPPPHKYSDPVPRIYTAVLQIFNSCGQSYSSSQIISVTSPASISGHLWEDNNVNGIEDSGEPPLQNWRVNLEKRDGTNWVFQQSTLTNAAGNYLFNIDVATAVFRVTLDYPTGQTWKTTYSYRSNAEKTSGLISIGVDRTITGVNFGNARWKTSSLIIPGYMARYNKAGNLIDSWYYSGLPDSAEYFEFTTSRDPTVRAIFMNPRNSNSGTFTIPSYSAWGNSSFTIYPREYNTYLKTTYNGESGAFYLRYWRYNGVDYFGIPFTVPDNTAIAASQLILKYYWDPVIYFKFDKPLEGEIIPYTNSYRVEVHFQGPDEDTSNCYLTTPVTSPQQLTYNSTIGEYARNIDTRTWEGQTVTFTARMYLNSRPRRYEYTYVTATVGWEPITTAITRVQSEATAPQIKGLTTVTGTVTGKWRDNSNVTLVVNDKDTYPMTLVSQSGTTSTLRAQFDPEPYAGKTIPLKILAYPQTGHGDMAESAIYSATVVSKLPLIANFTADPWTGPVPLWISFTDTSQGGPNWWSWNFNDGNTSNVQNPIKSYVTPGNYSVTLQVRNITGVTRTVSKWVNLTGSWHKTEINSDRYSYLKSGGELWWIATVDDSSITVNNTAYPVMSDDRVKLVLRSDINNTMNNRIELGGGITTCNLSNVSLFLNGVLIDNGAITAINMPDFQNFHTNLQLVALKNSTKFAMIKWDADDWRTISKTRDLNVYDLMPDWNKTMTLYLSDGFTTFDGWASDYSPK